VTSSSTDSPAAISINGRLTRVQEETSFWVWPSAKAKTPPSALAAAAYASTGIVSSVVLLISTWRVRRAPGAALAMM
jgi:hypothetical protein